MPLAFRWFGRSSIKRNMVRTFSSFGSQTVIAECPKMTALFDRARVLAQSTCTILITGETGTGKGLLASSIHALSPRAGKPFVGLNCANLSETLLESELFGVAKGAFTGAHTSRRGLCEAAAGGTLFLDEVAWVR
jgi:transcriptional regulator with PAS, ATPase and Fis domain